MEEKDLEKQTLEEINAEPVSEEAEVMEETEVLEAEENNEEEVLEASSRNVVVKLNVDFRTLMYYNLYVLKHVRKFYWLYAIFMLLLVGGATYAIIVKTFIVAALMGVFALYLLYQMLTIEKTIDRQLTAHFMRRRPQTQIYTFTDEGITVAPADGGDPIVYEWVYVSSIYQIPQFYYLYLGKQPVIVDRNPEMIIEGTKEDLDGIIMAQAAKKPYKRLDKDILKEPVEFAYHDYDAMEEAQAEQAKEDEPAKLEEGEAEPVEDAEVNEAVEAEVVEEESAPESEEEKEE